MTYDHFSHEEVSELAFGFLFRQVFRDNSTGTTVESGTDIQDVFSRKDVLFFPGALFMNLPSTLFILSSVN